VHIRQYVGYSDVIGQTTLATRRPCALDSEGHDGETAIPNGNAEGPALFAGVGSRWLALNVVINASYRHTRYLVKSIARYRAQRGNCPPTTATVATSHTEQAQCPRGVRE
jgi:hypothetical protein